MNSFGKRLPLVTAGILVASAPLIVGLARAQTNTGLAFDVASLKTVSDAAVVPLSQKPRRSGGRFTWNSPLSMLANYAYHLPGWRISGIAQGLPFYTVEATMDASATEDQVRLMLQTLLVERFKIVSHTETKDLQGYALVAAKNGSAKNESKLKTALASGEAPPLPDYLGGKSSAAFEGRIFTSVEGPGTGAITGRGVSMSQLADELSEEIGSFVVDRTGLTGKYYFGFRFASVTRPSDNSESPSIFSALQDELGLRLEKQKGPVEILVVDRYEKSPADN